VHFRKRKFQTFYTKTFAVIGYLSIRRLLGKQLC